MPRYQMSSRLSELAGMRRYLRKVLAGLEATALDDLLLAVNEAVTNIIVHGYEEEGLAQILIEVQRSGSQVRVTLRDECKPFDPTAFDLPRLDLPLDQRPLGKMGIRMTTALVDDLIYHRLDDGNELILVKRLAQGE